MKDVLFKTEQELCAAFWPWVIAQGWTPYAETKGWDILLVRGTDGRQIGVQAKLRFNLEVLEQTLRYSEWKENGPDHRCVLVPDERNSSVTRHLGIGVFHFRKSSGKRADAPISEQGKFELNPGWDGLVDWNPQHRHVLPAYVPDCPAGTPAPIQLTEWKIKALRLLALLEHRPVRIGDLNRLGLDATRWYSGRWITPVGAGEWIRGADCPEFDGQHPDVYSKIKAELAANPAMLAPQRAKPKHE